MKSHEVKYEINKSTWGVKLYNSHTYVKLQVSADVVLGDKCRNITSTCVRWRGNLLVLGKKMDESTISVLSHNTWISYENKKKFIE